MELPHLTVLNFLDSSAYNIRKSAYPRNWMHLLSNTYKDYENHLSQPFSSVGLSMEKEAVRAVKLTV